MKVTCYSDILGLGYGGALCYKMNYVTCLSVTFPRVTCLTQSTTTFLLTRVLSLILTTSNNSGGEKNSFYHAFSPFVHHCDDAEEDNDDVLEN